MRAHTLIFLVRTSHVMTARVAQGPRGSRLISLARLLIHCHLSIMSFFRCACHSFPSCFISDLFSDTTFRLVPLHISTCEEPLLLYGSYLVSGPASGQRSCLPAGCWYAWENNPTRDSWEHVGAPERALRWFLFPTNTWEPLLLTRVG